MFFNLWVTYVINILWNMILSWMLRNYQNGTVNCTKCCLYIIICHQNKKNSHLSLSYPPLAYYVLSQKQFFFLCSKKTNAISEYQSFSVENTLYVARIWEKLWSSWLMDRPVNRRGLCPPQSILCAPPRYVELGLLSSSY